MAAALAGLRVIDFGQYVAGPAVAMMLADFGADVIRIEPPGGSRWSSPAARVLNRGKRSIVLDLKSEADLARARQLIRTADVVIENFRPGVMQKLGLGSDWARGENSALIYLSLPGFASSDSELRDVQAWEAVIGAATGQFTDMGLNRVLMGINPSFSPLTLASAYAATFGATAVMAALYSREQSGVGDTIEVPIAACLLEGLAYNAMHVEDYPERYKSLREKELDRRRAAGEPMNLSYDECQAFCDPFYRVYRCADGRFFYPVAGSHVAHSQRILQLLGIWDEFKDELATFDAFLNTDEWPPEPGWTLSNYPAPKPWADRLSARMAEAFKAKPAAEWEEIFGNNRAPGAMVRASKEWLASDHAGQAGLIARLQDAELGDLYGLGPLAWFDGEGEVDGRRIPQADADRAAVLALTDDGRRDAPAQAMPAADTPAATTPWLDGIKVLDLCNVIAGPQISSTLIRFGAQVTSLGPVQSTMDPWNTIIFGLQVNQGKRSALADVTTPQGRDILHRPLRNVDIVMFNGPDRQLAALGLAPEQLREINPDLIFCKLDCYGGPRPGPRSHQPGYDDTTQASTGIMARFGGEETPEEHAHFGTIDVLGGIAGAFGAIVGLYERVRGGNRRFVRTSLAAAGQLVQAPYLYDHAGRPPFDEPSGRDAKGDGPLYHCYAAADGMIFLAVPPTRIDAFAQALNLDGLQTQSPEQQKERISKIIAAKPADHWQLTLQSLGAAAIPLGALAALRQRSAEPAEQSSTSGATYRFVRHADHPCGRTVTLVDWAGVRPYATPLVAATPAPKFGAQTREILAELGYTTDEIAQMLADGAIAESWSKDYMPT